MKLNRKEFLSWVVAFTVAHSLAEVRDSNTSFARDALQRYVDSGELPGAISVFYKDGVQETCCIGYADVAAQRAITMDDLFMQCSQTKGFCGVTVAKLVEEGRLRLDDPVSKYLPEFATLWICAGETNGVKRLVKAKNALTVRMCLNHTGGFPFELANFWLMGGWARRMPIRSVAVMAAAAPILFEPGTKEQYSNVGVDVGAAVVEAVTGLRWEDYLKKSVLEPLEMTASCFCPTEDRLSSMIEMYDAKAGMKAKGRRDYPSMPRPYGGDRTFPAAGTGLWTTANDQLKFYKMLMNLGVGENGVRILKEETVKTLLAVSSRPSGFVGYSLGLVAPEKDFDGGWFGHGGAWGTSCMVNWHRRELKLWVVQIPGATQPWDKARAEAEKAFFRHVIDSTEVKAYTGRMK